MTSVEKVGHVLSSQWAIRANNDHNVDQYFNYLVFKWLFLVVFFN